jgi:hypothetical protein
MRCDPLIIDKADLLPTVGGRDKRGLGPLAHAP